MFYYSSEKNVQILVALLKAHGIKKIVVSPGATNINFVASCQHDDYFELYSEVDERNAAYFAVGLSQASGEPVVITCTGATASRNYFPGLTEAFYRKIPILAVTASQDPSNANRLIPQFVDRSVQPIDTVKMSVQLQYVHDDIDYEDCVLKANKAILELKNRGGGPVHINLVTRYENDLSIRELPQVRTIERLSYGDLFPDIDEGTKVAIYVGAHAKFSSSLQKVVDSFCGKYDAIVFSDLSSGYNGRYKVCASVLALQEGYAGKIFAPDVLIHIGEGNGEYEVFGKLSNAKEVWRVSLDGDLKDTWRHLTKVFMVDEEYFFSSFLQKEINITNDKKNKSVIINDLIKRIYSQMPELPFSNMWLAQQISDRIPENANVVFGASITLRSFSIFPPSVGVKTYANVGGRGIDGTISTAIGTAIAEPDKLCFCVLGDLSFFYNLNALGNRDLPENLRILLINNGAGGEFKRAKHRGMQMLGEHEDKYVAAVGHFGNKSKILVKSVAESLGVNYISALDKDEAIAAIDIWVNSEKFAYPIIFEVFTDTNDESNAFEIAASALYGLFDTKAIDNDPYALLKSSNPDVCRTVGLFTSEKNKVRVYLTKHPDAIKGLYIRPVTWGNDYDYEVLKYRIVEGNDNLVAESCRAIRDMPDNRWIRLDFPNTVLLEQDKDYSLEFELSEVQSRNDFFQLLVTESFNRENGYTTVNGEEMPWSLCIGFYWGDCSC